MIMSVLQWCFITAAVVSVVLLILTAVAFVYCLFPIRESDTKTRRRKVFVSHPLSGNLEDNRKSADKICRQLYQEGLLPISPIHLFAFIDEETPELRDDIMRICFRLIDISDEVAVYGLSNGCRTEKAYAKIKRKRMVDV